MRESPNYPTSPDWAAAPDDPNFDPGIIDDIEDAAAADYWELHDEEQAEQFIARYLAQNTV